MAISSHLCLSGLLQASNIPFCNIKNIYFPTMYIHVYAFWFYTIFYTDDYLDNDNFLTDTACIIRNDLIAHKIISGDDTKQSSPLFCTCGVSAKDTDGVRIGPITGIMSKHMFLANYKMANISLGAFTAHQNLPNYHFQTTLDYTFLSGLSVSSFKGKSVILLTFG